MPCRRHRAGHPTQSQYTDLDTGPTCRCSIHWCGTSHWNTQLPSFDVLGQTRPGNPSLTFQTVNAQLHEINVQGRLAITFYFEREKKIYIDIMRELKHLNVYERNLLSHILPVILGAFTNQPLGQGLATISESPFLAFVNYLFHAHCVFRNLQWTTYVCFKFLSTKEYIYICNDNK